MVVHPTWPSSASSAGNQAQDEYLTVPEAAERAGKSESTLYNWIRAEKLSALGHPQRVLASELERLISQDLGRQRVSGRKPRMLWARFRRWYAKSPFWHSLIGTVLGAMVTAIVFAMTVFLRDQTREAVDYDPKPIIDHPSPEVSWIQFRYDPENPVPDRSGLRMDICSTTYRYYTLESWQIYPNGPAVNLYPGAGNLPEFYRPNAGMTCGDTGPFKTNAPTWPFTKLVPGDILYLKVSLFKGKNEPPAAIYQYVFVMGERDIIGGPLDGEGTPVGTPPVSSPVATPPVTPDPATLYLPQNKWIPFRKTAPRVIEDMMLCVHLPLER